MKTKHILFGIFISTIIASCNNSIKGSGVVVTSIRSTPEFTGVISRGSFNVYLTESPTYEVKIVADDNLVSHIETTVNNGILTISFKDNINIRNSARLDIYISAPHIERIDLEGSGNIETTNKLKAKELMLIMNGSGKIVVNDSCETATVQLNGSGNITLTGQAKNQTISLSGSGNINASGFATENTIANLSGSGSINVWSTKSLNAHLSGSGSIFYSGNPDSVTKDLSGSGTIEAR